MKKYKSIKTKIGFEYIEVKPVLAELPCGHCKNCCDCGRFEKEMEGK